MKTKLILTTLAILLALNGAAFFLLSQCEDNWCYVFEWQKVSTLNSYKSEKFGLRFTYPPTYFLETRELGDGHRGHFAIILTEDTEENRLVREGKSSGREGPVAITLDLYQSPEELTPVDWMKGHSASNFKLSDGTFKEITVAQKQGVSYAWDGLYRADNVVLAHNDYVASLVVTYMSPEDEIRKDFQEILATLEFR